MIGGDRTSVEYDSFGQDYRLSRFMRYDFRGNVVWECERYDNMAEQTVTDTRQVALRHTLDNSGRVVRTDYYPTGLPVDITLRSSATYHLAHELKHAYQFETGQLSIANKSQPNYLLYDRTDEEEAYQRGALYGGPPCRDYEANFRKLHDGPRGINAGQYTIDKLLKWSQSAYFKVDGKLYGPTISQ